MIGLIVGMGQVGQSLCDVLREAHPIKVYDSGNPAHEIRDYWEIEVLHICIPYSDAFNEQVASYVERVKPRFTVVHSTVPVGTCRQLGVYHSPVRGVHPHLADSMVAFDTYLAPYSSELEGYFEQAGMSIIPAASTDDTEAGKLWSLTAYAWNIMLEKQIHDYCEQHGLDFDVVYRSFTESYNKGFAAMGRGNVARPILSHVDGPIGGHCVIPAAEKLAADSVSLAALVVGWNDQLKDTASQWLEGLPKGEITIDGGVFPEMTDAL